MSKLMKEDISGRTMSNIYWDSFKEVVVYYSQLYSIQQWESAATICICDTGSDVGQFAKSDIIIVYDKEVFTPTIVTERIFRKNYNWRTWRKLGHMLKIKAKHIKEEFGFSVRISFGGDYIDCVHYKEEWWQWAVKSLKQ